MKWRTAMPHGVIAKDQAKIIVSVKYGDGSRVETEATVSQDSAILITKQVIANQVAPAEQGEG